MPGLLIHEWVSKSGGSEKVLDAMSSTFPDAEIFTLWSDAPERYPGRHVVESWLSRSRLRRSKAIALPFMPHTWRRIRVQSPPEWLLVSSHLFAHHAALQGAPDVPKFVYAHTPARYIWTPDLDGRGASPIARAVSSSLKPLDRRRSREATKVAANSRFIRERIQNTWQRDSDVIYPPVEVAKISSVGDWSTRLTDQEAAQLGSLPEGFILGASRFVPYKRLDVAIRAGEASGVPVVLAGSGPEYGQLAELAERSRAHVTFVDSPSDAMLYSLYQRALAYIFPPVEDFGIMPVEAMACGTPVIAGSVGGSKETVIDGVNGVVVPDFDPATLARAVAQVSELSSEACVSSVKRFDVARFRSELREWVLN